MTNWEIKQFIDSLTAEERTLAKELLSTEVFPPLPPLVLGDSFLHSAEHQNGLADEETEGEE